MQTMFKKCPFKENGKLLKLFLSDLWASKFATGVWYPAEQNPARYKTPQNKILQGIRPH